MHRSINKAKLLSFSKTTKKSQNLNLKYNRCKASSKNCLKSSLRSSFRWMLSRADLKVRFISRKKMKNVWSMNLGIIWTPCTQWIVKSSHIWSMMIVSNGKLNLKLQNRRLMKLKLNLQWLWIPIKSTLKQSLRIYQRFRQKSPNVLSFRKT